jgi:Acetyltransferase (GNAT) domain
MSDLPPYSTDAYAAAFGAPYRPISVPEWETSLLLRPIAASSRQDATGCYPRTIIPAGAALPAGLERLRQQGAVSVVLVLDPLAAPSCSALLSAFDVARPFKRHYLFDRSQGGVAFDRHHRYEIRRAARRCHVGQVALADHLPQWISLYHALAERHAITGIQRFSGRYFAALAHLPGLVTYAAILGGRIVAMSLWLRHGERAWSHLAAADSDGYRCGASYLLYAAAIDELRDCRLLDLGGTAGSENDTRSGLARFKRGFANATADAWLCGRVLDAEAYAQLSRGLPASDFFPSYRQPDAAALSLDALPLTRPDAPPDRSDTAP